MPDRDGVPWLVAEALDLLSDILGGGTTSRLYRSLEVLGLGEKALKRLDSATLQLVLRTRHQPNGCTVSAVGAYSRCL